MPQSSPGPERRSFSTLSVRTRWKACSPTRSTAATRTLLAGVWWASPAPSRFTRRRICRTSKYSTVRQSWGCSYANRKDGCRHYRYGRGRRNTRGRAQQVGNESHWSGARPASDDGGLQRAGRIALLSAAGTAPERKASARDVAAECECARDSTPDSELRQPGGRRHRALRGG